MPVPVLPAASLTPLLARVITLVVSVMPAVAASVPVQVTPPSLLASPLTVPLATVKSAEVRPVTASLKVTVTRDVPPMFSAVVATTILAVGRNVSMP